MTQKLWDKVKKCKDQDKLMEYLRENLPGVAKIIAASPFANHRVLERLTHHPSLVVRHELSQNSNAPTDILTRLCDDKDMLVRDYAKRTLKILQQQNQELVNE